MVLKETPFEGTEVAVVREAYQWKLVPQFSSANKATFSADSILINMIACQTVSSARASGEDFRLWNTFTNARDTFTEIVSVEKT